MTLLAGRNLCVLFSPAVPIALRLVLATEQRWVPPAFSSADGMTTEERVAKVAKTFGDAALNFLTPGGGTEVVGAVCGSPRGLEVRRKQIGHEGWRSGESSFNGPKLLASFATFEFRYI